MDADNWIDLVTGFPWWSIAGLILALVFRREISHFLGQAKTVSVGPVSLERELASAEEAERRIGAPTVPNPPAGAAPAPSAPSGPAIPPAPVDLGQRGLDAAADPSGTVLKSWSRLERALVATAKRDGLDVTTRSDPRQVLDALRASGTCDESFVEAAWNLRLVRNTVAHAADVRPTTGQAQTYADTATRLIARLG